MFYCPQKWYTLKVIWVYDDVSIVIITIVKYSNSTVMYITFHSSDFGDLFNDDVDWTQQPLATSLL